MYKQIESLPFSIWQNSDKTLRLRFIEVKGLNMVSVLESSNRNVERSYILLPTLDTSVFVFDTPNGRFTIGICSEGKELLLSPIGIFLQPYGTPHIKSVDMSINNVKATAIIGDTTSTINRQSKSE
jgi:hypothetical protein